MEHKESTQVGAAWKKTSAKGMNYISGKLNNGKYFTIFVNKKKTEDKHPDYRVIMDLEDATQMDLLDEYTLKQKYEKPENEKPENEKPEDKELQKAVDEIPF